MNKRNLTIIIVTIIIFLAFNFIGNLIVQSAGQTGLEILISYSYFALYGLIFGILIIFVDWVLGRKKKK